MARVVITGANGLLGHEVVRLLVEAGDEAVCIGRSPPQITDDAVQFVAADLNQPLRGADLPARADAVIHLAQSERFNAFPDGADAVFAVNVATTAALLDWARGAHVGAFVHASSGGLYAGGDAPLSETAPLAIAGPLAFYLSTKRAAEMLADAYTGQFAVAALRYFFIYGPRQRATMLVPRLIASVRDGRALTLQGADGMRLNPVFVIDAAIATVAAMRAKLTGVVNIAGPDVVSIRGIGAAIVALVGRAPAFETNDGAPKLLVADITRMRKELGAPTTSFAAGLKEMCG